MAYLPSQQKHFKSESNDAVIAPNPQFLIQDEFADKYKLARAKEFFIQGYSHGIVLGCGVEIHQSPSDSRFRIRMYDRDRKKYGKMKSYIEMSWGLFEDINMHKDQIKSFLVPKLRYKQHIFHSKNFSVAVVPPHDVNYDPMVEFIRQENKIYMSKTTFNNMMSYKETLNAAYNEHQKHRDEEKLFVDEMINLIAYIRNERRVNEFVKEPADWYQAGTVTTWKKFTEQVCKSKERLKKKRSRLSDEA